MAPSSNDSEDYHLAHTTKPLYSNSDVPFTDEEKRVIESLTMIKHKPVVFKRSKLPKEDTHHAGHAQVETNISSCHPQMDNHTIRLSHAQVESLSGFPVETENSNSRFSNWRDSGRQMHKQKKKYFELKDEDESEDKLFLRIGRDEVHKNIGHHAGHAQVETNNSSCYPQMGNHNIRLSHAQVESLSGFPVEIENPNSRFSNWRDSGRQMHKQKKKYFELKDEDESEDKVLLRIGRDAVHKDTGHHAGHAQVETDISSCHPQMGNHNIRLSHAQVESLSGFPVEIENPNSRFSNWRDSGRQMHKEKKKYFELKDEDESEDKVLLSIGRDAVHTDMGHHAGHAQVETEISSCHPQMGNHNIRLSHAQVESLSGFPVEIENPNSGFPNWRGSGRQMHKKKKRYFELKDEDESEDKMFLRIGRDEIYRDIGHHAGHAQVETNISFCHPQMVNQNIRLSHAQVESLSGFPVEIEKPNAGFSMWRDSGRQMHQQKRDSGRQMHKQKKMYFELKDEDESEDKVFLRIGRDEVHKDMGHNGASAHDNAIENPKTGVSNEGVDINNNGKRVRGEANQKGNGGRGRPRRRGQAVGVCDYQRSGRFEANIWLTKEKRQIHLGQYVIPEAAARASDKAMLVTRTPAARNLNYLETDYDMRLIEEWRKVFQDDANEFADILREQSKKYSEGCIIGLNNEAASQLMQLIQQKKKAELGQSIDEKETRSPRKKNALTLLK
ncbi:hypothetical protein SUGI_0458290 [Cryptomeria japonica]|nr:hypothetical protein SUGI_0458290 [Cryptomeria japonica]